ncbi:NADPH-dependent FMN reductase-domain-containing protein [Elsinoe ampelina]|uniref:NADPH-dependent FMN reductase-domain-containing protein n=1 Tax=Elsinoe ampelina TaxID=302913 RepID=A0A6A6G4Z2_9PEZI|nr:NADPH-dependent FMN reductase-domain-containing protein [Elsinoe ampelina]
MKIAIITGSIQNPSNTAGVAAWVTKCVQNHTARNDGRTMIDTDIDLQQIHLSFSEGHPLPLEIDHLIPQGHPTDHGPERLAMSYQNERVQAWSRFISSTDAVIIVSPQYNWSIPAPLKNAIDHLYHEWTNKPVALITLGGHGGTKACEALRIVLAGGLHARLLDTDVNIKLPRAYITGPDRLKGDEALFDEYRGPFDQIFDDLIKATEPAADSS